MGLNASSGFLGSLLWQHLMTSVAWIEVLKDLGRSMCLGMCVCVYVCMSVWGRRLVHLVSMKRATVMEHSVSGWWGC